MNDNKLVIGIIAVTILILGGGIWIAQKSSSTTEIVKSSDSKASVDETDHDWGTIQLKGGDVKKIFTIRNVGTEPLQLHGVKTSCMCTTARITIGDHTSPSFGMHQKSSWAGSVPSGDAAEVEVVFAPDFHGPSGVGAITREITVSTNDSNNPEITLNVAATVVKE